MEGTDLNGSDEEAYYDSIGVECIIDIDHGKSTLPVIKKGPAPMEEDEQMESDITDSSDGENGPEHSNKKNGRTSSQDVETAFFPAHFLNFDGGGGEDGNSRLYMHPRMDGIYKEYSAEDLVETDYPGISMVEGKPRTYVCMHCTYSSPHQGHVRRHVMTIHDKVKFPCTLCDHQSTTIYHLKRHMQSQHMHIKFVCDLCKFSSKKRENLKKHYLNIHTKILTNPLAYRQLPEGSDTKLCEKCDFITLEEEDLERHMEREHIDIMDRHKGKDVVRELRVPRQGVFTKDKDSVVEIRELEGRFYCAECEYSVDTRGSVSRHINTVHKGLRYPCDQCEYKATRTHHLKRHKQRVHNVPFS